MKNGGLVAMALVGAVLLVWGVGINNPDSDEPMAQNGMGGPAEQPLSSVRLRAILGIGPLAKPITR